MHLVQSDRSGRGDVIPPAHVEKEPVAAFFRSSQPVCHYNVSENTDIYSTGILSCQTISQYGVDERSAETHDVDMVREENMQALDSSTSQQVSF